MIVYTGLFCGIKGYTVLYWAIEGYTASAAAAIAIKAKV